MRVTIWHNIATDPQGRSISRLDGYSPGHPLVPVFQYEDPEPDPQTVAERAYHLLNVGDDPDFGTPDPRALDYRARRNRSLSKGDVVQVGTAWLACGGTGWASIDAPAWVCRNASAHGTTPLPDDVEVDVRPAS